MDFNADAGSIRGTGTALLQSDDIGDAVTLGDGDADNVNDLELTDTELAALAEGFASVTIGRNDGTHTINVTTISMLDDLIIRSPDGGVINVTDTGDGGEGITTRNSSDAASVTLLGDGDGGTENVVFTIEDDILTNDATIDITLDGAGEGIARFGPDAGTVVLNTVDVLTGEGRDITIDGTLSGREAAGPLDLEFLIADAGTVGNVVAPSTVAVPAAWEPALAYIFSGASVTVPAGPMAGNPVFTGDDLIFPGVADAITPYFIGIGGPELNVTLQPLTQGLNIGIENNDEADVEFMTQGDIDAFANGFTSFTIGRANGDGTMYINDQGSGATVVFKDPVLFRMPLGDIEVLDHGTANLAVISQIEFANQADEIAGGGAVIDNDNLAEKLANNLMRDRSGDTLDNDPVLSGGMNFDSAATTTFVAGRIDSDGTPIIYFDPVILTGDTELITTGVTGNEGNVDAGANIVFEDTLDGTSPGTEDVLLISGTDGDILFQGIVGGSTKIGNVSITDDDPGNGGGVDVTFAAENVTASDDFTAASVTQVNGEGNTQFLGNLTTRGNANDATVLGDGGQVDITTDGTILIAESLDARGGVAGAGQAGRPGGLVDLDGATVSVEDISTSGSDADTGAGGDAGTITVDADDAAAPTITLRGDLTAAGGTGSGAADGNGAAILIGNDLTGGTAEDSINFGAITGGQLDIDTTGDTDGDVTFDGIINGATQRLFIEAGAANVVLGDDSDDTVDSFSLIDVDSANNATFNGAVGSLTTVVDMQFTLTGDLLFADTLTLADELHVTTAVNVTANDAVVAGNILQDTGTGATTFDGTVTTNDSGGIDINTDSVAFANDVTANGGGDVDLTTVTTVTFDASADGNAPVTLNGGGSVSINNGGALTIDENVVTIDLNGGGSFSQTGGGDVELGADIFTESNGSVLFSSNVTLNEPTNDLIEIDTDRGQADPGAAPFDAGSITFLGDIVATNDESLTLDAGAGDVSVTGAVGTDNDGFDVGDIDDLLIVRANDVSFLSPIEVTTFTQAAGAGASPSTLLADNVDIFEAAGSTGISISTPGVLTLGNAANDPTQEFVTLRNQADALFSVGDAEFLGGDGSILASTAGGVSVLTIQPNSVGGNMTIGSGGAGGVALSNTDVNAIADGFELIFLGRPAGTGTLAIGNNNLEFKDPLFVRAPGVGGTISIVDDITMNDGADASTLALLVFDAPTINLGGTVVTDGQNVYFVHGGSQGVVDLADAAKPAQIEAQIGDDGGDPLDDNAAVVVTDASSVNTDAAGTAGDVFFEDIIDSQAGEENDLTVSASGATNGDLHFGSNAGQGGVTGRIGGNRRLGALVISDALDVTFGHDAGGTVSAESFEQTAGTGNTLFNGQVDVFGTGVFVALQTGGFNDQAGGNVSITTDGTVTANGAIVSRGGTRTLLTSGNGPGFDAGAVNIEALDLDVQRIDARGSNALGAGAGGRGGAITLNATDLVSPTLILRGDLLAGGGDGLGGGQEGSASDVTLGNDPATDVVTLDPIGAGAQVETADTILVQGNDVVFNATVDAAAAGADSLFVDTFADFSQSPVFGLTIFNADVGGGSELQVLRTDTNAPLLIGGALTARTPVQVNDDAPANHLVGGFTVVNTPNVIVSDEMTFNDGLVVSQDATLTANGAAGTVRFNNTVASDSDTGEVGGTAITGADAVDNDLTIQAVTTVFDDNGGTGTGFADLAADTVDGQVGPTTDAFDASLGANTNPLDDTLAPIDVLVTDASGGADVTYINTTYMGVGYAQFNDAVEVASDAAIHATGDDTTLPQAILFDDVLDSSSAETNDLLLVTTDGGTTRFNGQVGARAGAGDFTNALGHLQTDLTGDFADPGVADGFTEVNTDLIQTNGASQVYNDHVVVFTNTTFAEGPADGEIAFNYFLDSDTGAGSPFNVTVNTGGTTVFRSEVGLDAALSHLGELVTDAAGTTEIHADLVAVEATFNDAVLIGLDANTGDVIGTDSFSHTANDDLVTIGESGTTTDVTFASTVNSVSGAMSDLTVVSENTTFDGNVGQTDQLGTVITTDDGGPDVTTLNAALFTAETFQFDDPVEVEQDARVTGTASGDAILFNNILDGVAGGEDLYLITTGGGLTRFGDDAGDTVGGVNPLGIVRTDVAPDNFTAAPDGTTLINSAIFIVEDELTFNDPVEIGTDGVAITANASGDSTIRFNNTLDGVTGTDNVNDLTLTANFVIFDDDGAAGEGVLDADPTASDGPDGIVGGNVPLGVVTVNGPTSIVVNTTAMTGDLFDFNGPLVVAVDDVPTPADPNVGGNGGAVAITANNTVGGAGTAAVIFRDTVDSADDATAADDAGENNDLLVYTNNDGLTQFFGDIGNASFIATATIDTALGRLFTDADTTPGGTEYRKGSDQVVRGNGASIIHDDPVTLFNNVQIIEHLGVVHFNNTVDDSVANTNTLTVITGGGLTRFGDNAGDDTVGGTVPLAMVLTGDLTGTPGTDITEVNADMFADMLQFDDRVRLGDGLAGGGDGVIRMSANSANAPNTSTTFNASVNSVEDLAANLTVDALAATFGDGVGNDRVGTREDHEDILTGTAGALGRLVTTGTGAGQTTTFMTDVVLAQQMQFGSDVVVDVAEISFVGLADAADPTYDSAIGSDGGVADGVADAFILTGTLSSALDDFNDVNIDTVNGGDAWIKGRVGTMDTATAAEDLALPATAGDLEGTELGFLRTDNRANPLVDSVPDGDGHFLVNLAPHNGPGNLVANGVTHIDTDVIKAGGAVAINIHFYDMINLTFDGGPTYISDFTSGIFFHNTLDSEAGEDNDLMLYAPGFFGNGDIRFYSTVGQKAAETRLGDVAIWSARNVTADDAFKAASFTQEGTTDGLVGDGTSGGRGDTVFFANLDTSGKASGGPDNRSSVGTPGAAGDGGDVYILTDGQIKFFDGATLDGLAGGGATAGGNFNVQADADELDLFAFGGDPTNLQPEDLLVLAGTFTSLGGGGGDDGDFALALAGRGGEIPSVATIRSTFPGVTGAGSTETGFVTGDLRIEGASIVIGPDEKLTVFGDLTLIASDNLGDSPNVGGTNVDMSPVVHNDLASLGAIRIEASDIRFRLRAADDVVPNIGNTMIEDLGLDIIAGNSIFYQVVPEALTGTSGPAPIFGNPGADLNVNEKLQTFVNTTFEPVNESIFRYQAGARASIGIALDPSSKGPSNAPVAEALAGAIPTPEQSGDVFRETIVGDAQRQLLAEFAGVELEGLSPAQRLEFLTGRELYNDLGDLQPGQALIAQALLTENRLLYDPVSNMLAFYRGFFLEEVIDPQTGQPTLISRHIEHRRALSAAYEAYAQQHGDFDAQQFVSFVAATPQYGDAHRAVRGMKTLREKFELIGLTPRENSEATRAVAQRITPENMTVDQVFEAIRVAQPLSDMPEPEAGETAPAEQMPGEEQDAG